MGTNNTHVVILFATNEENPDTHEYTIVANRIDNFIAPDIGYGLTFVDIH